MKRIFIISLVLGFCTISLVYSSGMRPAAENKATQKVVSSSKVAPDFTLKDMYSGEVVSLSEFKGKPVFIDFWASWCPPCRNAASAVEELYKKFEGRVYVLGINLDNSVDAAKAFIDTKSLTYPQLIGTGTAVPQLYGVRGIPSFYIIDKEGNIAGNYVGFRAEYPQTWSDILDSVLEK